MATGLALGLAAARANPSGRAERTQKAEILFARTVWQVVARRRKDPVLASTLEALGGPCDHAREHHLFTSND